MATFVDLTEALRNLAQALQAIATVIGLMLAGLWTYLLFVQKRQRHARADVTHDVLATSIGNGKTWLHVTVSVKNVGEVLIRLAAGYVRIDQILPLPPEVENAMKNGDALRAPNDSEIGWPTVESCQCDWTNEAREIEPSEKDRFHFDFVVSDALMVAEVYSHFQNVQDRNRSIGWNYTTVYDRTCKTDPVSAPQVAAMPNAG
jgi:hypothetical protein